MGRLTPRQVLDECLARIDRYESRVRAWVFVDSTGARVEAERRARELQAGQYRGPLHGIPMGIKDIIDVFDWPTAAGSKRWAASVARRDAVVVRRLRQAGAVLLGKTVTTQYASFDPPPTRNPWNLERTPGGSSSGSAAAVACGMCLGAIGSQTGGSITRPASYCGVAGFKPSYGVVTLDGFVPLAPSMDHPGPLAGCVADLALLFDGIADPDARRAHSPGAPIPRLVRARGLFQDKAEPGMLALMDHVCDQLRVAGAEIAEAILPTGFGEVLPRHRIIMAVEAAAYHEPRLRQHPDDYQPWIRKLIEEGLACPAPEYFRCQEHAARLKEAMAQFLAGGTILLAPATVGPAPDAATTGDPAFNSPWSYTGLPTVSFPAGWTSEGLPLAIQLVSAHGTDAPLLAAAAWCERALGTERREPACQ